MDDNPDGNKVLIDALNDVEHQIVEFRDELKRKLVTKLDLDEAEKRIIAAIGGAPGITDEVKKDIAALKASSEPLAAAVAANQP